jgi:hypothetical protein
MKTKIITVVELTFLLGGWQQSIILMKKLFVQYGGRRLKRVD